MTIRDEAFSGQPVSAFVVDAHTHISPYYMSGWYQSPSETSNSAVVAKMDRLGIDCIVTASHKLIMGMTESANKTVAEAADQFPGRIYGYISICPGEGLAAVKAELKKYEKDSRFLGLKLLPGYHGSLDQREYEYALDFADEKACIVLIHTWGDIPPLTEVEASLRNRNRMKLLCAHQGGGSASLSQRLAEIIKRHPNIYMEICGSLENTLAIEDLVGLVGEDRLIYGSDQINLDVRYDFGRIVFSPLSDDVKKMLLSENYLSLLNGSGMGRIL
jgi:Predicted metal-dependent hydrolase of the TIM-barrel fold